MIIICISSKTHFVKREFSLVMRKLIFGVPLPHLRQTGLYSHRRWLEAWNFRFRKTRDGTSYVFTYAKSRFSHDAASRKILTTKRTSPLLFGQKQGVRHTCRMVFVINFFRIFEIIIFLLCCCYVWPSAQCGGYISPSLTAKSIWKSFLK